MVANLETNIKMRYFQYIQRFINVRFNRQQFEKTTIRQNFNTDQDKQMATSALRFRLRQVKSLFLEATRADLTVWNNDIVQGLVNQYNITHIEATRIVNQVNQLTVTTLNEFLRSTALNNILYPLNCNILSCELKVDPQRFLQPSLFISRYLELNGAKPFNVSLLQVQVYLRLFQLIQELYVQLFLINFQKKKSGIFEIIVFWT
ncbi:hypothetical protein RCL1_001449 [Eukaryota sp. TZLM3-RCL]